MSLEKTGKSENQAVSNFESRFRVKQRDMSALGPNSRVVAYLPGLRTILHRLRATSATPSSLYTSPQLHSLTPSLTSNPGSLLASDKQVEIAGVSFNPLLPLPGVMAPVDPPTQEAIPTENENETSPPVLSTMSETDQGVVECLVQQCPPSLHSDFMDLFPGVTVKKGDLLVITLCEKTMNDMTSWSRMVGEEREQLMQHFIETAKEICARLSSDGLWADFVEPYSGRAFYSPHSNVVLQETDERFRYLGFDVRDLGCCRSIAHPTFGCHAFVGTVFTNARIDSPSIQSILQL